MQGVGVDLVGFGVEPGWNVSDIVYCWAWMDGWMDGWMGWEAERRDVLVGEVKLRSVEESIVDHDAAVLGNGDILIDLGVDMGGATI